MAEVEFKENIEEFIDLSIKIVNYLKDEGYEIPINSFTLQMGKMYLGTHENHDLVTGFIKRSYDYWDKIKEKDNDFLINNSNVLFAEFDTEHVNHFNDLFKMKKPNGEYAIPDGAKNRMWEILEKMVINSIKYIHQYRDFEYDEIKQKKVYKNKYFPNISVGTQVQIWNVTI